MLNQLFSPDADFDKCMKQGGGALAALPPPMDQLVTDVAVYDNNILTIGKLFLAFTTATYNVFFHVLPVL